jgi:hypothetical protein
MRQELEVMRVLRVPPLGKLVVEVNGERYERIDELTDEHGKRRLLAAVGELISFAGNYDSLVDAGVAPPVAAQAATTETTGEEDSLDEQQARFISQLERQRDAMQNKSQDISAALVQEAAQAAVEETETKPPPVPQPAPPRPTPTPPRQPDNVAAQIDTILQDLKAEDPDLASRAVHLRQNPAGGLHIEVDGRLYNQPGEIEDTAVQTLIRQAVQIWRGS